MAAPGPFPLPKGFPSPARVLHIALHAEVSLGMASFVERVSSTLKAGDILLLDIKTFGGRVDAAVRIRDALLHCRERGAMTVAYINPRAISAGALISYANDVIAVAPGATMGAATPVQIGSGGQAKPVAEKIVSYMRQEMRATAEARGRRGDVAEAMVDADVKVAGLIEKGKLLTLDGKSAMRWGVASIEANNSKELFEKLGYDRSSKQYTVNEVGWSWAESIAGWLSSATVSGLLMTVGMLGLMIGLYSGGSPIPIAIGGSCLLLFFFGHYVTRLTGWEDVLLFGAGAVLNAIELAAPGGFIFGLLGALCVLSSLFLGLINFDKIPLDVQWDAGWIGSALTTVFASIILAAVSMLLVARHLPQSRLARPLMLETSLESGSARDESAKADALVGRAGIAISDLRPAGKVEIDGQRMDALAEADFIPRKSPVEVIRRQGFSLVVRSRDA